MQRHIFISSALITLRARPRQVRTALPLPRVPAQSLAERLERRLDRLLASPVAAPMHLLAAGAAA